MPLRLHAPAPDVYTHADAATPALRTLWLTLFARLRRAIPRAALREALTRGDRFGAEALLQTARAQTFERLARPQLRALLAPVFTATTAALVPTLPVAARPATFALRTFAGEEEALTGYVNDQVVQMTLATRLALWAALWLLPAWMVAEVAGLTRRQVVTVSRAQASWAAEGLSLTVQRARLRQAVQAALLLRADVAAKTQLVAVANLAQDALWQDAVARGVLDPRRWERVWMAQPGACPLCEALDGQRATLGAAFAGGVGQPPRHQRCRCSLRLARVREG